MTTNAYKGQDPDLLELLQLTSDDARRRIWTMIPGEFVSVDAARGLATVRPVVLTPTADGAGAPIPAIYDVPWYVLETQGMIIRPPAPKAGDRCMLQVASVSITRWLLTGNTEETPDDPRRHSLTDAVALVGLRPVVSSARYASDPEALVIGRDDDADERGPLRITLYPESGRVEIVTQTVQGWPLSLLLDPASAQVVLDGPTIKLGAAASAAPALASALHSELLAIANAINTSTTYTPPVSAAEIAATSTLVE